MPYNLAATPRKCTFILNSMHHIEKGLTQASLLSMSDPDRFSSSFERVVCPIAGMGAPKTFVNVSHYICQMVTLFTDPAMSTLSNSITSIPNIYSPYVHDDEPIIQKRGPFLTTLSGEIVMRMPLAAANVPIPTGDIDVSDIQVFDEYHVVTADVANWVSPNINWAAPVQVNPGDIRIIKANRWRNGFRGSRHEIEGGYNIFRKMGTVQFGGGPAPVIGIDALYDDFILLAEYIALPANGKELLMITLSKCFKLLDLLDRSLRPV